MKKVLLAIAVIICATVGAEEITLGLACSSACESYHTRRLKGNPDPKLIWGWGEVLGEFLSPEIKILNAAISGTSTKTFREKGYWKKLAAAKPDFVFLALGANDTPPKKQSTTLSEYRENQLRFYNEVKAWGGTPIFVTLNQSMRYKNPKKKDYSICFSQEGPLRKERVPYSQVTRDLAKELGAPCLELFDTQFKYMSELGEERCAQLYRWDPQKKKFDPSHTNKEGARFVAMIIAEQLAKSDSELAKYVLKDKVAAAKKEFGLEK